MSFTKSPITEEIKKRIVGISYPKDGDPRISFEDLCYITVLYCDFNNETQTGELICNNKIADDVLYIFEELYKAGYQIEKIKLIDEYMADDEASMSDNNSSAFNFRVIANTNILSNHALGMAVDINPLYNPYITYINGRENIAPMNSVPYVDREKDFPHKLTNDDLCVKLFKERGFGWGGDWEGKKDYQHFDKK